MPDNTSNLQLQKTSEFSGARLGEVGEPLK